MALPPRISLTARLTLLFATSSGVVLLALGWLIGDSIERHFEELDREALQAKLMLAHHAIARITTQEALERLPSQLSNAATGHHDLIMHIVGPDGQVLLSPANNAFSGNWLPNGVAVDDARLLLWSSGGHQYRGLVAAVSTGIPGAPPLQVAVAMDIAHHQIFMSALMQTLWLFVVCAAAVTGVSGWLAASRGLAPLKAMRARAELVTAQKLDQRLPTDAVPPELAELANTLNEMLARLEEAFRRLSDFSSDIAHELRTPVSNLMTQTQVSLSRPRDAEDYRAILESNAEEFERLGRMISDMLFLAKADNALGSSRLLVSSEPVDLAHEVGELFGFYEALAEEKSIRLILHGAARAQGDRLMLRRAISNLVSNALRYTPPGGCMEVHLAQQNAVALLTVENPGPDIPPEHLARLFERFYRADPSRNHIGGEGTGLGLAITQAIVLAHKGQISATSANGRTCFTLHLPGV